ncbi:hypothetical protein P167DRAFT_277660 [Morchella conica CCBAS932]|uniref:Uncharacterized protein n=1 Tax=Morchella conica CCBAS932 TaxID=1392247 RepID=A0A3N4KHY3_9PEZI|nr:hypothetical protein P167DRAFT_277660 [Morchella conica CCBAS932]
MYLHISTSPYNSPHTSLYIYKFFYPLLILLFLFLFLIFHLRCDSRGGKATRKAKLSTSARAGVQNLQEEPGTAASALALPRVGYSTMYLRVSNQQPHSPLSYDRGGVPQSSYIHGSACLEIPSAWVSTLLQC